MAIERYTNRNIATTWSRYSQWQQLRTKNYELTLPSYSSIFPVSLRFFSTITLPKKTTTKIKQTATAQGSNGYDPTGQEFIEVWGAREHNLKDIDVKLPRNKLVVVTGISGSGKSSLAFDTIYAEGQRRYMESFSAYARSFIGNMERPDVDKIEGLSPVISIEQKTTSRNPRSTVGTVTEIYDFLRLLFARAGHAYSYLTGKRMIRQTEDQIIDHLMNHFQGAKLTLLAPVVKGRKGHYRELFQQIRKQGFTKVRVDGELQELVPKMQVDRYKTHDIEILIDRVAIAEPDRFRIGQSVGTALNHGKGSDHAVRSRWKGASLLQIFNGP